MSLDGELNDLEQHFVSAHLGRCGACAAFAEDATAFTSLLRDAPLEPVSSPVTISARSRRARVQFRTIAQIASVASVVIAAGTIALAHEIPGTSSETSAAGAASGTGVALGEATIRSLRREALVQHDLPVVAESDGARAPGTGDGASVTILKPPLPVDGT